MWEYWGWGQQDGSTSSLNDRPPGGFTPNTSSLQLLNRNGPVLLPHLPSPGHIPLRPPSCWLWPELQSKPMESADPEENVPQKKMQ